MTEFGTNRQKGLIRKFGNGSNEEKDTEKEEIQQSCDEKEVPKEHPEKVK